MTADGANGASLQGAGAGGGIYLACRTFAGAGAITARGGVGGLYSGSGGGGRIAVAYADTNNWSGTLSYAAGSVNGGTGGNANGTAGTIVWTYAPPPTGVLMMLR